MVDIKFLIGIVSGIILTSLVKLELNDAYFIWQLVFKGLALILVLTIISLYLFPNIYQRLMGAHLVNLLVYLSKAVPHLYNRESSVIRTSGINCGLVNSNGKFLSLQYRPTLLPQMTGKKIVLFKTILDQYESMETGTVCPVEILSSAWHPGNNVIPPEINYIVITPLEGYSIPFTPTNFSMVKAWILNGDNNIIRIVDSDQQIWP